MDNNAKVIKILNEFMNKNDVCSALELYKMSRLRGDLTGSPFQIIANLHFSTDNKLYYSLLERLIQGDEGDLIKKDMFDYVDGVRLLNFEGIYQKYIFEMTDKDGSNVFHRLFANNYISACYKYFSHNTDHIELLKKTNRAGQTPITLYLSTKTTPLHDDDLEHFKYFQSLIGCFNGDLSHYKNAVANLAENYIFYPIIFEEEISDIREFYRLFKYNLLFVSDFYNVNPFQIRSDIEQLIKNRK
jgi:hypothetical protein